MIVVDEKTVDRLAETFDRIADSLSKLSASAAESKIQDLRPDDQLVGWRDLAKEFGRQARHAETIHRAVRRGELPPHDERQGGRGGGRYMWRLGTIRAWKIQYGPTGKTDSAVDTTE